MSEFKIKRSFNKNKDLVARFQSGEELILNYAQLTSLLEYVEKFLEDPKTVWNDATPDFDVLVELRDGLREQLDNFIGTLQQEFCNAVTPTDFAKSFNGGNESTITLNDVTVKTLCSLPSGVQLSDEDKAQLMLFYYQSAGRTYAKRRAEKM